MKNSPVQLLEWIITAIGETSAHPADAADRIALTDLKELVMQNIDGVAAAPPPSTSTPDHAPPPTTTTPAKPWDVVIGEKAASVFDGISRATTALGTEWKKKTEGVKSGYREVRPKVEVIVEEATEVVEEVVEVTQSEAAAAVIAVTNKTADAIKRTKAKINERKDMLI